MQVEAGIDGLQIFDSHGGLMEPDHFDAASGRWMKEIVTALQGTVPVFVFSRGTHHNWPALVDTGAHVLEIDHDISLAEARRQLPETVGMQGNLRPDVLVTATPEEVAAEAKAVLAAMRGRKGH